MDVLLHYLELEFSNLELCPEEDRELFVHDALSSLLLGTLDLLQLQVPEKVRFSYQKNFNCQLQHNLKNYFQFQYPKTQLNNIWNLRNELEQDILDTKAEKQLS